MSKLWDILHKIENHKHFTFDEVCHIYNGNTQRAYRWLQDALANGRVERKIKGYRYIV